MRLAGVAVICLTISLSSKANPNAQSATAVALPDAATFDAARLREATTLLERFVADRKIAGAVAGVARNGRVDYLEAAGFQNIEARTPMTERSIFRIYSMSKAVTAVSAMMLYEQGKFALQDPVSKYLPEFRDVKVLAEPGGQPRAPQRAITIADLLLHTSGLSHRTSELYRTARVRSRSISLPEFIRNITRAPLMEDPGTRYRYSESPTVVGRLVEVWSGRPVDVYMKERIFGPLGMIDTGFWTEPSQLPRLTTMYAAQPSGSLRPYEIEELPFSQRPALLEGAVGLLSTVPDFMRFCQMLLNKGELEGKRVLSSKTVHLITANGLPEPIVRERGGIGWGLANVNVVMERDAGANPPNIGEYGWDGSAGTVFWIDPEDQLIIVLMTQNSPANPDSLRQRFKTSIRAALR